MMWTLLESHPGFALHISIAIFTWPSSSAARSGTDLYGETSAAMHDVTVGAASVMFDFVESSSRSSSMR